MASSDTLETVTANTTANLYRAGDRTVGPRTRQVSYSRPEIPLSVAASHGLDTDGVELHYTVPPGRRMVRRDWTRLESFQRLLDQTLTGSGVGEYDGNLVGPSTVVFYCYGPDRYALWRQIEPLVPSAKGLDPHYALLQKGGARPETRVIPLAHR